MYNSRGKGWWAQYCYEREVSDTLFGATKLWDSIDARQGTRRNIFSPLAKMGSVTGCWAKLRFILPAVYEANKVSQTLTPKIPPRVNRLRFKDSPNAPKWPCSFNVNMLSCSPPKTIRDDIICEVGQWLILQPTDHTTPWSMTAVLLKNLVETLPKMGTKIQSVLYRQYCVYIIKAEDVG